MRIERLEERARVLARGLERARVTGDDRVVLGLVRESRRLLADVRRLAREEELRREGGGR